MLRSSCLISRLHFQVGMYYEVVSAGIYRTIGYDSMSHDSDRGSMHKLCANFQGIVTIHGLDGLESLT